MNKKYNSWLVIGGAGYIGSHVARSLKKNGSEVIILDDLSLGIANRVPKDIKLIVLDCTKSEDLNKILIENNIVGIIHMAALKQARESIRKPLEYYDKNISTMLGILKSIPKSPVKYMVFSSSCSVYGASSEVSELFETKPISPYGRSKMYCEEILQDCSASLNISFISLRYFNVIGNDDFPFAFDTSKECLIPAIYSKISSSQLPEINGINFPTPDGSVLRDYIDVRDLADAHYLATQKLIMDNKRLNLFLNVGTGKPVSVLEIVKAFLEELKMKFEFIDKGRSLADPHAIWADTKKFKSFFCWEPKYSLKESIKSYINRKKYDEKVNFKQ